MASKRTVKKYNNSHLQRTSASMANDDDARGLHALGHLSSINHGIRSQAVPLSTNYLYNSPHFPGSSSSHTVPPPLPPRLDQTYTSRYNSYSGISSYYSPYSRFSRGMYSPAFGGYRTPYSRFSSPHDSYNSFIQLAEESSRPAFESIESVVEVVSSISMMLESTYHAVHSSYSAILGVVDQFSRLKTHVAEVFSVLAILRALRWLCLKILYLLKLRKDNPSVEAAWKSAKQISNSNPSGFGDDSQSPWPFFVFLSLVVGAPWLMFKLLSRNIRKTSFDYSLWANENGKLCCVKTAYDFESSRPGELTFHAGEEVFLAPKTLQASAPKGWLVAANQKKETGLIPANYLISSGKTIYARNVKPDEMDIGEPSVSLPSDVQMTTSIDCNDDVSQSEVNIPSTSQSVNKNENS